MAAKLRNAPKQKRSQSLVEDVIEATAKLIPDSGYDRATTNKIAELAGVSIGSLYRYFPNKQAIFRSLLQKVEETHRKQLQSALTEVRHLAPRDRIEPVVGAIIDLVMQKRKLMMVLYSNAPQLGAMEFLVRSRQSIRNDIEMALDEFSNQSRRKNSEIAARLIVSCVHGVLEDLIQADSTELEVEVMKKELTDLFRAYLFGDSKQPPI